MTSAESALLRTRFENLRKAAIDTAPIAGLTHKFYRYPARFSPTFAASAIREFSDAGDLVLDPYMGGGTTIVEAMALGRDAVGSDINSLASFITRAKTTALSSSERIALMKWATETVPTLSYSLSPAGLGEVICEKRTANLQLPVARPIKKVLALALLTLEGLPTTAAKDFARCAMLNVGQWALNGRKRSTPLHEFRHALGRTVLRMLDELSTFESALESSNTLGLRPACFLISDTAANLIQHEPFPSRLANLVVTSPPYPGIHMLYHRWQVDGRRETPAPYWIASCQDGQGAAFYNFADRREHAIEQYFVESLRTLKSIRRVMKPGAHIVQMIAFSQPATQLRRYLANMSEAGFEPVRPSRRLISRRVPNRRWHAALKGAISASREIVLVHEAI